MDAEETIRSYYDTLRNEEALSPYFARDDALVKFGISERLAGQDAVSDGLSEQTRTTTDWEVGSRDLRVTERERHAWFSDEVRMAWTDTGTGRRREFDSRWSGTLEDRDGWVFVGMHVSAAHDLG
jgi:hypothetical protein